MTDAERIEALESLLADAANAVAELIERNTQLQREVDRLQQRCDYLADDVRIARRKK